MLFHPLPQRADEFFPVVVGQFRDIRRWIGRRGGEQVFEDPLAALHGAGAGGVRGDREDARLTEQAAPLPALERDLPKLAPLHVGQAVVAGEPFVDERVVGFEKFEHAAIVADDVGEKLLRFPAKRLSELVVEAGKTLRVGLHFVEPAQLEPLAGKVLHERPDLRVAEHPLRLRGQLVGRVHLAAGRRPKQGFIRNTAPQEEREPRRQFVVAEIPDPPGRRIALRPKQERRRHEQRRQGELGGPFDRLAATPGGEKHGREPVEFLSRGGAAEGPGGDRPEQRLHLVGLLGQFGLGIDRLREEAGVRGG